MESYNIKTNRIFTKVREYAWILTVLVAIGGIWYPKLGLLVIPIMLSLTIMSIFRGRYWCGNFCAHGSLFDKFLLPISKNGIIFKVLKSKVTIIAVFLFFGFNMNKKFIQVFSYKGTAAFWDKLGLVFVTSYLMVLIVGGTLSIINTPRAWCQVCPMGFMQTIGYKIGKITGLSKKTDVKVEISNKDSCLACGLCSRVCPMQLTPHKEFDENNQFNNEICIKCSTCINKCPKGLLSLE